MISRCPGQDRRNLKIEELNCPGCGLSVEIFSDEIRRRCPGCASQIVRQRLPSCADWCKAAKECLGEYKPQIESLPAEQVREVKDVLLPVRTDCRRNRLHQDRCLRKE